MYKKAREANMVTDASKWIRNDVLYSFLQKSLEHDYSLKCNFKTKMESNK